MAVVILVVILASPGAVAQAAEYYVAPTGSDSNPGTITQPFATLQRGHTAAVAGDTVYIRGGTYSIVGQGASSGAGIAITKSGTSDANRIKFWAYGGEVPVFDFSRMTISTTGYTVGFSVTGSWLHFKGLEISNVPMNTRSNTGFSVADASNDIFELMNFHHNNGSGFFISRGTGGHLVLNCDSHDNYDPTSSQGAGQNADGFGVHYQETGPSTVIRGCRAWWNSDDGYDLISQEVPVTIEGSWAMGNGYINSGTARPASGNGNGFKAGSSKTGIRHTIRNCLAWGNPASGFYANHSSGGNDWYNNTSYNNGTQYNMLASPPDDSAVTIILSGTLVHRMRNNIGFPNRNSNMGGVDTMFNTWDLNVVPAAADFTTVMDTGFMGPRQTDGSLPASGFMKLRAGSRMIDQGTDVRLPFVGAAPDLGAFEYGATPTTGTGGVTGSGGTVGTGGNAQPGSGGTGAGGRGTAGMGAGGSGTGGGRTGNAGSGGSGTLGTGGLPAVGAGSGGRPTASAGTSGSVAGHVGAGVEGGSISGGCACAIGPTRPVPVGVLLVTSGAFAWALNRRRRRADRLGAARRIR